MFEEMIEIAMKFLFVCGINKPILKYIEKGIWQFAFQTLLANDTSNIFQHHSPSPRPVII